MRRDLRAVNPRRTKTRCEVDGEDCGLKIGLPYGWLRTCPSRFPDAPMGAAAYCPKHAAQVVSAMPVTTRGTEP